MIESLSTLSIFATEKWNPSKFVSEIKEANDKMFDENENPISSLRLLDKCLSDLEVIINDVARVDLGLEEQLRLKRVSLDSSRKIVKDSKGNIISDSASTIKDS